MITLEQFKKNLNLEKISFKKTETGRLVAVNLPIGSPKLFGKGGKTPLTIEDIKKKGENLLVIEANPDNNPDNGIIFIVTTSKLLAAEGVDF